LDGHQGKYILMWGGFCSKYAKKEKGGGYMGIDFEGLIREISKSCLGEDQCGECKKEDCLVGYCKKSLTTALKQQDHFIDQGMSFMPYGDTKLYDEEHAIDSIGYLLNQCKGCNLYHDEDCIINIVRSALEIILLGDVQDYKGSSLLYLNDIKNVNEQKAKKIYEAFQRSKKALNL
jgi:hypothetical protein